MNTATLQVIVNDFHDKIEKLNEELVEELMHKDELQVSITKYSFDKSVKGCLTLLFTCSKSKTAKS